MKKILFVVAALLMTSTLASAGTIAFTNSGSTVNLNYNATAIGGGLTQYDVFLDDPSNGAGSYFLQLLGFTGTIKQDAAGSKGTVRVNGNDAAADNDGNFYDMTQDSFFFQPFSDNLTAPGAGLSGVQDIAPGANPLVANAANAAEGTIPRQYLINAGSGGGSSLDFVQIAQIIASGNVSVSGGIGRSFSGVAKTLTGSGTMTAAIIPEPSSFALLGMGAVGLAFLARRRKAA